MLGLLNFETCLLLVSLASKIICLHLTEGFEGPWGAIIEHIWICNVAVQTTLSCVPRNVPQPLPGGHRKCGSVAVHHCVCCSCVLPVHAATLNAQAVRKQGGISAAWAAARSQEGWSSVLEAQRDSVTSQSMSVFCLARCCPAVSCWGSWSFLLFMWGFGFSQLLSFSFLLQNESHLWQF